MNRKDVERLLFSCPFCGGNAAVEMENSTQHVSPFKLIGKDKPLIGIIDRADEIKERRAKEIVRILNERNTPRLFPIEDNPFGSTSCGLFCGK